MSPSTSREVAWVCALQWPSILHKHSGSQPWDVLLWFLHYHHCNGNTQCWEVRGARLINFPFFPVVTPDLNGTSVWWIRLSGTGVRFGGGSLLSQVKPVTVRIVYYVSDIQASLGMKRVSGGYCSVLCLNHTSWKWQEKVLKLRRKVVNFSWLLLSGSPSNAVKVAQEKNKKTKTKF